MTRPYFLLFKNALSPPPLSVTSFMNVRFDWSYARLTDCRNALQPSLDTFYRNFFSPEKYLEHTQGYSWSDLACHLRNVRYRSWCNLLVAMACHQTLFDLWLGSRVSAVPHFSLEIEKTLTVFHPWFHCWNN